MRNVLASALIAAALLAGAAPSFAASRICIDTRNIVSQKEEGRGAAILFTMRDGTKWRNTLNGKCPDLTFEGYVWNIRNPDHTVCENQQTMRTIESGSICMLGKFEKVAPAKG